MTTQNEIWKDVPGFSGSYQVSNFGRIKSFPKLKKSRRGVAAYLTKEKIRTFNNKKHYPIVDLYHENGKCEYIALHRLVAKCFIPNPNNLPFVNHKDTVKTNNHVDNLEWISHRENVSHGNLSRSSKPIGASWKPSIKRWVATIMLNKKQKYLGSFLTQEDAGKAYQMALIKFNVTNKYL